MDNELSPPFQSNPANELPPTKEPAQNPSITPSSASGSLYRFSRMVKSSGNAKQAGMSKSSIPPFSATPAASYRFARVQQNPPGVLPERFGDSTTSESVPLSAADLRSGSPTVGRRIERPTKYRFSLPSRESILSTMDLSSGQVDLLQGRSLSKGILIFLVLVSPFVGLLMLSSLALVNRVDSTSATETANPATQFDYSPIYARTQELVQRGELKLALQILSNVPEASAQRDQISTEMVRRAQNSYPRDLAMAVHIVSSVPSGTTAYEEARRLSNEWGDQLISMRTADYAANQQKWSEALASLDQLRSTRVSESDWFKRVDQSVRQQKGSENN